MKNVNLTLNHQLGAWAAAKGVLASVYYIFPVICSRIEIYLMCGIKTDRKTFLLIVPRLRNAKGRSSRDLKLWKCR